MAFETNNGSGGNFTASVAPTVPSTVPGTMPWFFNASAFDGTNDYTARGAGLTGASDSRTGLLCAVFRINGGDGTNMEIAANTASSNGFVLRRTSTNAIKIFTRNVSAASGTFDITTTATTFTAGPTWYTLIAAWDTNYSAGNKVAQVYINGTQQTLTLADSTAAFDIDYTTGDFRIGSNPSASNKFNGDIALFWMQQGGTYVDLTNSANRALFRDSIFRPISLGLDGSIPTGAAPIVYCYGQPTFFTFNRGTGGNFTTTGTLDLSTSSPNNVYASDFDGTNDYMTRGANLTSIADSDVYSFSFWFRKDGADGAVSVIMNDKAATVHQFIEFDTSNRLEFGGRDSTGTKLFHVRATNTFTASATWHHVCGSCNANTGAFTMYIDDVSVGSIITNDGPFTFPFSTTVTDWVIGAYYNGSSYISKLNGCISELWFAPNQYVDFSDTATRRKFVTSGVQPVYLGSDGSTPTGTAPKVYFKNPYTSFQTNAGTGGNFTVTGALTDASSQPGPYYNVP